MTKIQVRVKSLNVESKQLKLISTKLFDKRKIKKKRKIFVKPFKAHFFMLREIGTSSFRCYEKTELRKA